MDDRMADSQMMGDITGYAFDQGYDAGKEDTLKKVKEIIDEFKKGCGRQWGMIYCDNHTKCHTCKELLKELEKIK